MDVIDVQTHINPDLKFASSDSTYFSFINKYFVSELLYETFFQEHMLKNSPCIINSVTDSWSGLKWITNNKPNFEYLDKRFGEASVPVANCKDKYYNAQKKEEQCLKHYLHYWKAYALGNYPHDLPCLYLKDWHFTRDFPEEDLYRVPSLFSSDWLNEYFTARQDVQDDYRFVYMGPKGSWTPLHADVFSSFSWSVNLCGKKRWVLYPPGQEKCLTDLHGNLAYDVESPSLKDSSKFSNYHKLETSFEIIQNPGEAIFVPSGWHHQVWNLEDTISINHNWINGCNIGKMWTSIKDNLSAVKKEISDCEEMEGWNEHCQVMLNATYGLDYKQFCQFLLYIVQIRLKHLSENTPLKVYGDWLMGINHLKFDIIQVKNILEQLLSNADFTRLCYFSEAESVIRSTLDEIDNIMDRK